MWFAIEIAAYASLVLGYLLLMLLAVRQRIGRGPAQRLLELTLLLAVVWTTVLGMLAVFAPGGWWSFVWHRVAEMGLVVLALLTAEFTGIFVQSSSRQTSFRPWPRRIAVIVLAMAAIGLDNLPARGQFEIPIPPFFRLGPTELGTLLLVSAWLISMGAAWWAGVKAMRGATNSKHRNRIRYLYAALVGFTVGDLLILGGGIPDVYVGLVARLLGFGVITFTLLRYGLPDIRRFGLATLRLVLLVGVTVLLYLVALWGGVLFSGLFPNLPRLALAAPFAALALVLAATVDVLLSPRLYRFLDRTIMGRYYDVQKALRAYGQRINLILDLERLADTTLNWLRTTLRVERSCFILFSSRGADHVELSVLRSTHWPYPQPQLFTVSSRFLVHFDRHGRPLSQYDLDMLTWFQFVDADERQWLKDLTVDLYIPILVADETVALLALGSKAGGQPYSDDDLETLMILAGQTATALENARLLSNLRVVQNDLHRLNTELAETNRQLARLDQTKTDFIAIASHELRTPLTQIYGYSDILSRLDGDDLSDVQMVDEFVDGISRGADRLRQVVDAMIDVSLIETGSLGIIPGESPLSLVVQNAVEAVEPAVQARDLALIVHDLGELPEVQADGGRLEQVFVSLLTNAVKFTPDGGRIIVSGHLAPSSPEGECVEVLIADTGIGIDPEQQDLIFEKFYRAENLLLHSTDSVRFKGAGPGLGLAIAKGIVDAHGGRIWVESLGRDEKACPGSAFYVRLPISGPARG
jgi:signal transduction histidine kinase